MTTGNDGQQFAERAQENRLHISLDHAAAIEGFANAVEAAISTIREIDTTGFEPAAIFVPTPSGGRTPRASANPKAPAGRESD